MFVGCSCATATIITTHRYIRENISTTYIYKLYDIMHYIPELTICIMHIYIYIHIAYYLYIYQFCNHVI